jgi:hypothetical protein
MTWINTNAWREVLARVFEGFVARHDVTPDWLVNPETNRRLKLDVLYPEIGVAIRFRGLQGRKRRWRPCLEEEHQQQARDAARVALCEVHGISLVGIDVVTGQPKAILRELSTALSKASRRLAKSDFPQAEKGALVEGVSRARSRLDAVARRLRRSEDLKLYAELWQDRQYAEIPQPEPTPTNGRPVVYTPGMSVCHVAFGDGVVQAVEADGDDNLVTVLFADGSQKTFAASLISDKLAPSRPPTADR